MKKTKPVMRSTDIVEDYICNSCGNSCKTSYNFEGLLEAYVCGGYGSVYLGDGNQYEFDICEKCLIELFKQFKVPVKITEPSLED